MMRVLRFSMNNNPTTGWAALCLALVIAGCGGADGARSASSRSAQPCMPPTAPFAKVMNPAFAPEYANCVVTTNAAFHSPDWGAMVGGEFDGHVKWSALAPGEAPASGPLGSGNFKLMYVEKGASDVLFALKPGDPVRVTGHTMTSTVGQVMFVASQVRKD